jgi:sec-independent protein translocase protein TatA
MDALVAEIFGMDGAIVAVIAIAVLFGAKKIPEMARSIGRAQGEFKKGMKDGAAPDKPESDGSSDSSSRAQPSGDA